MDIFSLRERIRRLGHLVGNTPLLGIDLRFEGRPYRVFAKAEHLNMTGSIKDRMALHILRRGYEEGELVVGARVAEVTSGNTGISFAALGRALDHEVTIFMPDWMSLERINLLRSYGASIRLVSTEEGGFRGSISLAEAYAAENPGCFLPRQFENVENVAAHEAATGPELWWQLRYQGRAPDAFVAGVGTGGTIMGVGRFLRRQNPAVRLHPVEPANSPTLSHGLRTGTHRIQGISDDFVPSIVDLDFLDEVVKIDDGDAILMAQKLARELGLGVGISSGANLLGAVVVARELGSDSTVATVFPDDNKKYLSTDLVGTEPAKASHLTPHVELRALSVFKRVCLLCCEGEDCERSWGMEEAEGMVVPHCLRRPARAAPSS